MNFKLVSKYLGHFTIAIALLMLPSAGWAAYFHEWHALAAFFEAIVLACVFGVLLSLLGRRAPNQLYQREALALVGLGVVTHCWHWCASLCFWGIAWAH